ncbi:rhombotarget lipoprotein [Parasalinivibrio latis]|uniref:rhombotarget lipoprotein n=1 Tax=Parasalinivibrio latis TaxID=2952610 RepID=UPI0030E5430D
MAAKIIGMMVSLMMLTSCSAMLSNDGGKKTVSSSLITYLYPDESDRETLSPQTPTLKLPVTVGLAFVPSGDNYGRAISGNTQLSLLNNVKQSFQQYDFIGRIELIPSNYLKDKGGFSNLEQVARLYDVDVMALVSYDQVSQSYENNAALLYWTIVGLYLIPGNENSVQTFVDTAVFDVKSKKMLFRAPGISKLEKRTTAIGINETLSEKSVEGFELATKDMIINLDAELGRFKERVKEEKVANVEFREGYSGGAIGILGFVFLGGLSLLGRFRRSKPTLF